MTTRFLCVSLGAVYLSCLVPSRAEAETDFRSRMLVLAHIDGYAGDDDTTAIGHFISVVGDQKLTLPDDVAAWIGSKLGTLESSAVPRLTGPFMHFLRAGAVAPPFISGAQGSARNNLLRVVASTLQHQSTPLANLALLMFEESDDPFLNQMAASADYSPLKSFPWLIGDDDWMSWIIGGLNINNTANPGLLPHVRSYLSGLDLRPPVAASSINFLGFTKGRGWANLKGANAFPAIDSQDLTNQATSLSSTISARLAVTLGITQPASTVNQDLLEYITIALDFGLAPSLSTISAGTARGYLSTLKLVQPQSGKSNDVSRLASVLGEQQGRLLALAAYGLVAYQQRHKGAARDIGMQDVFSQLATINLATSESKTTIVQSLSASDVASASGLDLDAFSKCNPTSFKLLSRKVSLIAHAYLETINAVCANGTATQIVKTGAIPTDFVRMLEVNPAYLDMVDTSLTARDFVASLGGQMRDPDDLYLIESEAWTALATCLADLAHPDASWQYSRDMLLQHFPRSAQWFIPGWRPRPAGLLTPDEEVVLRTDGDFTAQRASFFLGEANMLQWTAEVRYLQGIAPALDAMSSSQNSCVSYNIPGQGSGVQCGTGGSHPSVKQALETKFNAVAADATKAGQLRSSLSDPGCLAPQTHSNDVLQTVIDQDTMDFAVRYTTDACFGAAQANLKSLNLPSPADQWLSQALTHDPLFLNRYQLDLLPSSPDMPQRLATALSSAAFESSIPLVLNYLSATGLLFYLPDISVPQGDWDGSARTSEGTILDSGSPLNATTAPLLNSQSGIDLAVDLATLQMYSSQFPPALTALSTKISDGFIGILRDAENKSISQIDQVVDPQIAKINSAIAQQQSSNFTIGFSVGIGAAVVPGIYFSYDGVGLNISLSLPSTVIVAPVLPMATIPEIPLAIPGTDVLGPLLPTISLPLSAASTFSADPSTSPSAADSDPPDGSTFLTGIDWGSLLSQNNYVGRIWLQSEVSIATPLLTPQQLQQISQAFQQPSFPTDLAKLIAQKAEQAAGSPAVPSALLSQSLQDACNGPSWSSCGIAVKRALDATSDPNGVVDLAVLWSHAFDAEYDTLRKNNHLESSTPEAERVFEVIDGNFNPIEMAKDKAEDALVKRYLPRLATVLEWANASITAALSAFLTSQDAATDYDELKLMDDAIQNRISDIVGPSLVPDWKDELNKVVTESVPQLKPQ